MSAEAPELPDEVWLSIFTRVRDWRDCARLLHVCRTWRRLALDHTVWLPKTRPPTKFAPATVSTLPLAYAVLLSHAAPDGHALRLHAEVTAKDWRAVYASKQLDLNKLAPTLVALNIFDLDSVEFKRLVDLVAGDSIREITVARCQVDPATARTKLPRFPNLKTVHMLDNCWHVGLLLQLFIPALECITTNALTGLKTTDDTFWQTVLRGRAEKPSPLRVFAAQVNKPIDLERGFFAGAQYPALESLKISFATEDTLFGDGAAPASLRCLETVGVPERAYPTLHRLCVRERIGGGGAGIALGARDVEWPELATRTPSLRAIDYTGFYKLEASTEPPRFVAPPLAWALPLLHAMPSLRTLHLRLAFQSNINAETFHAASAFASHPLPVLHSAPACAASFVLEGSAAPGGGDTPLVMLTIMGFGVTYVYHIERVTAADRARANAEASTAAAGGSSNSASSNSSGGAKAAVREDVWAVRAAAADGVARPVVAASLENRWEREMAQLEAA